MQFPNTAPGFWALVRHLGPRYLTGQHIARVVYEPTSPYHGAFERAAELKPTGQFFADERLPWFPRTDEGGTRNV